MLLRDKKRGQEVHKEETLQVPLQWHFSSNQESTSEAQILIFPVYNTLVHTAEQFRGAKK